MLGNAIEAIALSLSLSKSLSPSWFEQLVNGVRTEKPFALFLCLVCVWLVKKGIFVYCAPCFMVSTYSL